jgi:hypothetical protein
MATPIISNLKRNLLVVTTGTALICASPIVNADIKFNGYASIVAGMTMDDNEIFLADPVAGGTYNDQLSLKPESIFALQTSADLGDGISVTAQMVARGANDFDVEMEWAYLSLELNESWTIQAGRKGDVLYKYSDFRDVGYAYPFGRAPSTMYTAPFNSYDGLNFLYTGSWGWWDVSWNTYYGNVRATDPFLSGGIGAQVEIEIEDFRGTVLDLAKDSHSMRAGYHTGDINVLSSVFLDFGLPAPVATFSGEAVNFTYLVAGYAFDNGSLIFSADMFQLDDDGLFNDTSSVFVNIGYRLGDWTPNLSYSYYEEDPTDINVAMSAFEGPAVEYNITSLTLKYDFHPSATFKIDYSMLKDEGELQNTGDADVISFGIDLVF